MNENREKNYFNGIDPVKGDYHLPPLTDDEFLDIACRNPLDDELQDRLAEWCNDWVLHPDDPLRAPVRDVEDPSDLSQAGWAVVFPEDADPEVELALSDLLEHRRDTAGSVHQHYCRRVRIRPGEAELGSS